MNNNPSMIYHDAYICEIAKLPIQLIADPLPDQKDPNVLVCKRYGLQKPIIVYLDKKGGLYREEVYKWRNVGNGHEGYGVLELLADVTNRPMLGADLKQMCSELVDLAGKGADILDHEIDYREYVPAQKVISYTRKPGFTVEELNVLGCTVYLNKDGIICYGFDCNTPGDEPYFTPDKIKKEFRCYPLLDVTLPEVRRNGEMVSERIIATPFNPMFVCFADVDEQAGCIVRPGMPNFKNIVFSKSDDFTISKVARWLGGDAVFTQSLYQKSLNKSTATKYSGFRDALNALQRNEKYQQLKDIWHVKENGKQELVTVDIKESELKADNIIFCHSVQDAIATYFHLNALKESYPNSADLKDKTYHVCFNFGDVSFSVLQYSKAHGFAHRIYTFFPNDAASVREARMIGKKYREIYRAALPESFADISGHCSRSRIYQHKVSTIRDFFLVYKMDKEQAYSNDYDLNKFFLKSVVAALPSSPLKHNAKKDKNGETKDDFWTVNAATLWEFMASEGYCRVVSDKSSTDKVGRFYHLDFPFFDELDRNSMVSATRQCLRDYARTISRPDSNDYEKICDTIAKAREISDKTIDGLPEVEMNYKASYNEKLDHFYYRNCALRITPMEITAVPYDKLTFFVNRSEVLPWDFQMPFLGDNVPFNISENPEYVKRKQAIEAKKSFRDEEGNPLPSEVIDKEQFELDEWGRIHRWKFDFRGKPYKDWWPPLLVLRCFANEFWREEIVKKSFGEELTEEETDIVNAHLANLLFCLARPLYRYHGGKTNCAPYLMENKIQQGQRAQGGSGKSTFVDTFMGCAGYVLDVDGKNISPSKDLSFEFSDFVPRHHRVVHIEDLKERQSLDPFYNYITGKFRFQKKFVDVVALDKEESPGIVLSSNFAPTDLSDSTAGRYPLCGFSDRFCRPNIFKNQRARSPADIMKDFSSNPERLSQPSRNQIAYICALGVQFIMKYDEIAPVPTAQPLERAEENKYGKSFMQWKTDFFVRLEEKHMFGIPLDLVTYYNDYLTFYVNTSERKEQNYSRGKFYEKLCLYCNDHDMVVNPKQVFLKEDGKMSGNPKSGKFRLQAWCQENYFYEKDWENDPTITPKSVRVLKPSNEVFFIFEKNDPNMPANYGELLARYKKFLKQPDPDPILDEDGKPYELTEEEQIRWKNYKGFRQGKPRSDNFSGVYAVGGHSFGNPTKLSDEEVKNIEEALPFPIKDKK